MKLLRIAAAVICGYLASALLTFATDAVVGGNGGTREIFSFVNLLTAFPYGILGGRLAARIALDSEMAAAAGTALFSVAMSVFFLFADPGNQPLWYWIAMMASLAGGAVYGGYLRVLHLRRNAPRKASKRASARA